MEQKKALNRKKLKVILVICIVMIVTAGIGLAAYIHHVDTVTLGRKVSVYRFVYRGKEAGIDRKAEAAIPFRHDDP